QPALEPVQALLEPSAHERGLEEAACAEYFRLVLVVKLEVGDDLGAGFVHLYLHADAERLGHRPGAWTRAFDRDAPQARGSATAFGKHHGGFVAGAAARGVGGDDVADAARRADLAAFEQQAAGAQVPHR